MPDTITIPRHVGIILDGNRRWAKQQGKPAKEGHKEGYKNLRKVARTALDMGVEYLSVYGFATANWARPKGEVDYLMGLFKAALRRDIRSIDKEDIRLRFCGSEDGLDPDIVAAFRRAESITADNKRGQLVLCINYSGQQEILDAIKTIIAEDLEPGEIDKHTIQLHMYVPDLPDMDLLIRTSGEQRISDFMPWRAAQAEFMLSDKLWPDFTTDDMAACLQAYGERNRRLGR